MYLLIFVSRLPITFLMVPRDLDHRIVQPLLAYCPNLSSLWLQGARCTTTRLGLALYNLRNVEYLYLDSDGHVNNFLNAFNATTYSQVLDTIFKRAPNLVGLFIPLPDAPDKSICLNLSKVKFPKSLRVLGLKSNGRKSTVDIKSLENILTVAHLARILARRPRT